jgi:hypothetical protein
LCNVIDEYVTGKRIVVQFAREHQPGRKIKDPNDRKETGYLGFYTSMQATLEEMQSQAPDVYSELHEIIRDWIAEAR